MDERLPRVAFPLVGYVAREFRIAFVAKIAQRIPKIYRPRMFMLDEGREPGRPFGEEFRADLLHQPPRNTPSSVFGCHREAIDVAPPSVPSANHGTDNPVIDCCDQE